MRIGIDATPLSGNLAGIGRYTYEICKKLDQLMPNSVFYLYSPDPINLEFPSERWHIRVEGRRSPSSYIWIKRYVKRFCKRDGIDVFWATRTISPAYDSSYKILSTVHDLNHCLFPEFMPLVTKWAHRLWFSRDVKSAAAVVAVSKGTAMRIKSHFNVTVDAVAPPAVSPLLEHQDVGAIQNYLLSLDIDSPYFLAVGTLEPRKNMEALFKAFINLKKKGELQQYILVVVGGRGWKDHKIHELINKYNSLGIVWLGRITDSQLAKLYHGATALLMPSLYEGFGIPLLEARACGLPILSTDIPEMREAGGEEGIYISPTVQGIEDGIREILTYPRSKLKVFPEWLKTAEIMSKVLYKIGSSSR